jgi:hypothetical protein
MSANISNEEQSLIQNILLEIEKVIETVIKANEEPKDVDYNAGPITITKVNVETGAELDEYGNLEDPDSYPEIIEERMDITI